MYIIFEDESEYSDCSVDIMNGVEISSMNEGGGRKTKIIDLFVEVE